MLAALAKGSWWGGQGKWLKFLHIYILSHFSLHQLLVSQVAQNSGIEPLPQINDLRPMLEPLLPVRSGSTQLGRLPLKTLTGGVFFRHEGIKPMAVFLPKFLAGFDPVAHFRQCALDPAPTMAVYISGFLQRFSRY
jgi:hypothetical protein